MAAPDRYIEMDPRQMTRIGLHSQRAMQRQFDRVTRQWWAQRQAIQSIFEDGDMIWSERMSQLLVVCGVSLKEQELRDAIQNYLDLMAFHVAQGHTVTYDDTYRDINQIAEEHGYLAGVPIPVLGEHPPDLVMASGVPLAEVFHMNQELRRAEQDRTELEREYRLRDIDVRNSWHMLGDQTVCVVETTNGPMALPRPDAGLRLQKMMRGMDVRHHANQTAEAELKALESLRARITESQYNSYVLCGMFPERSERSDIYYFFRKGLPTIAVTYHGKYSTGKILCALCLHPMGYYQGTHVGLMTPTDEVIAHLLMMRSDEHKFWAKSGQWSATDTRSGI